MFFFSRNTVYLLCSMHQTSVICDFLVNKLQQHKHLYYFILSGFEYTLLTLFFTENVINL